jgi:hypothetical protein
LVDFEVPFEEGALNISYLKEQKADYSPSSNSMIGFSLPLRNNGLPDTSKSLAKTSSDIVHQFTSMSKAAVVITTMAQPMGCIQYGRD